MNAQISITERITKTIAAGRQVEEERKRQAALAATQAEAKLKHELALEWAPHMETLCTALPDWVLPYVVDPEQEYSRYIGFDEGNGYAPISIVVPYLAPIAAYVYQGRIYYAVAKPQRDEDGIPCLAQLVYRRNKYELHDGETDFAIAVMQAKEAWDRYTTMLDAWEAAQREAQTAEPVEERIPLLQRLPSVEPAEYLVNILDSMPDMTTVDAAPLWSALMLGMELRGIRSALEDIAAALTVPPDEEMVVS